MIPVIVQDFYNKKILMQSWVNINSLRKTFKNGYSYYYSRKRKKIWLKGIESCNYQIIKKILIDCDFDSVIFIVIQINKICCHFKKKNCFFNNYD
ncbi:phosphoribosyl-AMP cyclohydrolase [Candidatus Vidania fulgoroideorum]